MRMGMSADHGFSHESLQNLQNILYLCGSSRTLGQRSPTQTALLSRDLARADKLPPEQTLPALVGKRGLTEWRSVVRVESALQD